MFYPEDGGSWFPETLVSNKLQGVTFRKAISLILNLKFLSHVTGKGNTGYNI